MKELLILLAIGAIGLTTFECAASPIRKRDLLSEGLSLLNNLLTPSAIPLPAVTERIETAVSANLTDDYYGVDAGNDSEYYEEYTDPSDWDSNASLAIDTTTSSTLMFSTTRQTTTLNILNLLAGWQAKLEAARTTKSTTTTQVSTLLTAAETTAKLIAQTTASLDKTSNVRTSPDVVSETTKTKETTVAAQSETTNPKETTVAAQSETTKPKETTVAVQSETTNPKETTVAAQSETTKPKETTVAAQSETTNPKETTIAAQSETTNPKETTIAAQSETTKQETVSEVTESVTLSASIMETSTMLSTNQYTDADSNQASTVDLQTTGTVISPSTVSKAALTTAQINTSDSNHASSSEVTKETATRAAPTLGTEPTIDKDVLEEIMLTSLPETSTPSVTSASVLHTSLQPSTQDVTRKPALSTDAIVTTRDVTNEQNTIAARALITGNALTEAVDSEVVTSAPTKAVLSPTTSDNAANLTDEATATNDPTNQPLGVNFTTAISRTTGPQSSTVGKEQDETTTAPRKEQIETTSSVEPLINTNETDILLQNATSAIFKAVTTPRATTTTATANLLSTISEIVTGQPHSTTAGNVLSTFYLPENVSKNSNATTNTASLLTTGSELGSFANSTLETEKVSSDPTSYEIATKKHPTSSVETTAPTVKVATPTNSEISPQSTTNIAKPNGTNSTAQKTTKTPLPDFFWVSDGPAEESVDSAVTTSAQGKPPFWGTSLPDYQDEDIASYFGDYPDVTTLVASVEPEGVALAFFKVNWYWILIGIIVIILLFLVPGMLMQIYCHKFYKFYRSEMNKKRQDSSVSDDPTDITDHEVDSAEANPVASAPPTVTDSTPKEENAVPRPPEDPQPPVTPPSSSNQAETHRVDVYTGPCSIPSLSYPSLNVEQQQPQNVLPTMQPSNAVPQMPGFQPQATSFKYPSLQYQTEHTAPISPLEPVVVYSIPVKGAHVGNSSQKKTFGDEAIIDSNRAQPRGRQPSADRPQMRVPKPEQYSAPARPPKPQQYRTDKPVPKSSNYRDYRRQARGERPWAGQKRRPRPKEESRPDKIIVDNPRGNDYGRDSNPEQKKRTKSSSTATREFRRREELLRQLIKGFNEAEVLQKKLDRTRQWTREQNKRDPADRQRAKRKEKAEGQKDRPPRYEDVMSDASKPRASRPKRRSEGRRRVAR